jgi:uncharacterized membrane protein YfcA
MIPSFALFVVGTTIGGYGTLIGAGGGFLLVPVLLFFYPAMPAAAITALSLSIVTLNALSGSIAYAWMRRIDYHVAAVLLITTVPATMIGARTTAFVPRMAFEVLFGGVLLALGVFLLWKPLGQKAAATHETRAAVPVAPAPGRLGIGLPLSAVVGFVSGLLGIGGSPLQVVILTHVMHVPVHTAMPTSQFMVLFGAAAGALMQLQGGYLAFGAAPIVLLGAGTLLGAQLGAALSHRISGRVLVRLMALALLVVGLRLLLDPLF